MNYYNKILLCLFFMIYFQALLKLKNKTKKSFLCISNIYCMRVIYKPKHQDILNKFYHRTMPLIFTYICLNNTFQCFNIIPFTLRSI